MIVLLILLAMIALGLLFWQISNLVSVFFGSPYVMMDKITIQKALEMANLKKGEIFYDLGCGRGDVLIEASKVGAKATGYEISPLYWLLAKIKTRRYRNIKIAYRNLEKVDLSKADVVYCYLLPKILGKLSLKFKRELKSGSHVISIGFSIETLKKTKENNKSSHRIYLYVIP